MKKNKTDPIKNIHKKNKNNEKKIKWSKVQKQI